MAQRDFNWNWSEEMRVKLFFETGFKKIGTRILMFHLFREHQFGF